MRPWRPFRRPLNTCSLCGHRWRPRGQNVSKQCPGCRRDRPPEDFERDQWRTSRKKARDSDAYAARRERTAWANNAMRLEVMVITALAVASLAGVMLWAVLSRYQ